HLAADHPARALVERVQQLEGAGAVVDYASVDIANEGAVADYFMRMRQSKRPPVRGVMHCASVWQDERGYPLTRPLARLNRESVNAVLRPKALGGYLLSQH